MVSDKRMDELINRAEKVALRTPDGSFAEVFRCVLAHLVDNERPALSVPWNNLTATGAQVLRSMKALKGKTPSKSSPKKRRG